MYINYVDKNSNITYLMTMTICRYTLYTYIENSNGH